MSHDTAWSCDSHTRERGFNCVVSWISESPAWEWILNVFWNLCCQLVFFWIWINIYIFIFKVFIFLSFKNYFKPLLYRVQLFSECQNLSKFYCSRTWIVHTYHACMACATLNFNDIFKEKFRWIILKKILWNTKEQIFPNEIWLSRSILLLFSLDFKRLNNCFHSKTCPDNICVPTT